MELTLSAIQPHVGDTFTIVFDEANRFPMTLVEATEEKVFQYPGRSREPFQIQFRSPEHSASAFLPQRVYLITHETLGDMQVFLVPIGPPRDGSGGFLYQAVFN